MRILVLCYEYPPLGGGGGRVAQSIAEQMAARGHEVRVQTAALGWRSRRDSINGVEVFRTASGRRAPDTCRVHEMGLYCATSFFPTLRHIREWKPDVIHAHYLANTPPTLIKEQKANYFRLENQEEALHGQALVESQNERERICLWLSARGIANFDGEGSDTDPPIWQPWADLIDYWRGE